MKPYGEILANSEDRPPFANGTEGDVWMSHWCEGCAHDTVEQGTGGCPLLMVAILGCKPAEWVPGPRDEDGHFSMADQWQCLEFKRIP